MSTNFTTARTEASSDQNHLNASSCEEDPPDEREKCPDCGGVVITTDGEQVCEDCGLVVDDTHIDHGPDWRGGPDSEDNPSRAMAINRSRHDNGIGTVGYSPGDSADIDTRRRALLSRRSESRTDRRIRGGVSEIKRLGSALDVPRTIVNEACVLFKRFYTQQDDCRGHNIDHLAAAALYVASRDANLGLVTSMIVDQVEMGDDVDSEFTESDLFTETRYIADTLDIALSPRTPAVFIPRMVSQLGGSPQVDTIARTIATDLDESEIVVGSNPAGVAAGVVYEAFDVSSVDEDTTQKAVAEVAGVSIPTVRSSWKTIKEEGLGGDPRGV